jgi:hypothetical protein
MPTATPSKSRLLTPPEEQFWQRYSPHHEFPLSSATSIALHILAIALLALLGWWIAKMTTGDKTALSDVPVVVTPGDGGGSGPGPGGDQGGQGSGQDIEETGPKSDVQSKPQVEPPRPKLPREDGTPLSPLPPAAPDEEARRLIAEGQASVNESRRLDEETRRKLKEALGRGGRPGRGKSMRDGDGPGGPGIGTIEERVERMGRWVMVFETYSGDDYAQQLAGLDAIVAVPMRSGGKVSYAIIHDLNARPARLDRDQDLAEIKRVWWEDTKRESIAPLCLALGIRPAPDHLIAFFPESLERKLLKLELQHRALREDQIKETRFKVRKTANGYEPVVIDQKAK